MSHPALRRWTGLGLGTLAMLAAVPVLAADLAYPPYPGIEPAPSRIYRAERIDEELPHPPPPREPVGYGPRFVAGPHFAPPPPTEECRTVVRHRVDAFGDEIERRVRICEEPVGPRVRPSFHRPPPVPPGDVPYGEWDGPPRW